MHFAFDFYFATEKSTFTPLSDYCINSYLEEKNNESEIDREKIRELSSFNKKNFKKVILFF